MFPWPPCGSLPSTACFSTRTCPYPVTLLRLAQAIFEPNLFPYKYLNILNPSHSSYRPAYEDGTETLAYKILTLGNCPEESIQLQRKWRSWICRTVFLILLVWKLETVTDMMSRVLCVCRQQCHLLECGLFCGHYDSTYC